MAEMLAVKKGDLLLRWCFNCNFYEWARIRNGRFICQKCKKPVGDWVTHLLYTKNNTGK